MDGCVIRGWPDAAKLDEKKNWLIEDEQWVGGKFLLFRNEIIYCFCLGSDWREEEGM